MSLFMWISVSVLALETHKKHLVELDCISTNQTQQQLHENSKIFIPLTLECRTHRFNQKLLSERREVFCWFQKQPNNVNMAYHQSLTAAC